MTEPGTGDIDLRAEQINDYLQASGWRRQDELWRGSAIWTFGDDDFEVQVPVEGRFRDDARRIREVVLTLARVESRPEPEIVRDISEPLVDVQRYHTRPDTPSGTMPLDAGIEALQGIRKLFDSAARTVARGAGTQVQRGRPPNIVVEFLRRVRLGPSVAGSYILTAHTPLSAPGPATLFDANVPVTSDQRLPFERRAILQMHEAITSARAAAQIAEAEGNDLAVFDDFVAQGVSANVCEGLAALGGQTSDRPFEIGFVWARGLPADVTTPLVAFEGRLARVLKSAGEELRSLDGNRATIEGDIIMTHRDMPSGPGRVKVKGALQVGDRTLDRTIWIGLDEANYRRALQAHDRGWRLRVVGEVVETTHRREIQPYTGEVHVYDQRGRPKS